MSDTIKERKPPTIADIVREKTDDGARIIDFFLDLMEGYVAGAMLCHRIDAAKQLVKYGSKEAADFIAEHRDEPCDHCESRKRGPRSRNDESPATAPQHAPGPYGYDFLTLLTEDFLTVLSAVDEDLMIMLLRAQTRDGGTVIDFLYEVMQGREDGFKTHHRIAAAKELISHIVRDEQPTHTPSPLTGKGRAEGDLPPLPQGEGWGEGDSPAPAATQTNGASPAVPAHTPREPVPAHAAHAAVVPAEAGTQGGGGGRNAAANSADPEPNPIVVPAEAGTQGGGGARSAAANSIRTEPALSTAEEPKIVRPELVEGQCSGDSAVPGSAEGSQLETNNSNLETLPAWHAPDPHGAPIDSTTPGRSPP